MYRSFIKVINNILVISLSTNFDMATLLYRRSGGVVPKKAKWNGKLDLDKCGDKTCLEVD